MGVKTAPQAAMVAKPDKVPWVVSEPRQVSPARRGRRESQDRQGWRDKPAQVRPAFMNHAPPRPNACRGCIVKAMFPNRKGACAAMLAQATMIAKTPRVAKESVIPSPPPASSVVGSIPDSAPTAWCVRTPNFAWRNLLWRLRKTPANPVRRNWNVFMGRLVSPASIRARIVLPRVKTMRIARRGHQKRWAVVSKPVD